MLNFKSIFRYQKDIYNAAKRGTKQEQIQNIKFTTLRIILLEEFHNQPFLFSIPTFYYGYQIYLNRYDDINFYQTIRKSVDWINIKLALGCGMLVGLEMMKFIDFKAKNLLVSKKPRSTLIYLIPIFGSFFTLSYFQTLNPWILPPQMALILGSLFIYGNASNFGVLPFWTFSVFYQMFLLDVLLLGVFFLSMRKLREHRRVKPQLYQKF
ncbi:hypothetical protein pb186bvf_008668 [Paramecium bursaria]